MMSGAGRTRGASVAGRAVLLLLGGLVGACGSGSDTTDVCAGFVVPERADTTLCKQVDVDAPSDLATCLIGSGHAGTWAVDDDGLPAYDLTIDQRCDPVADAYTPREQPLRDLIHLIGNGRGLVAMAHASGGVEIYSQDRGHKWINRIDSWRDPETPGFPVQLGGGFNYVVVGDQVLSTRFDDLAVGEATSIQSRRFGVGYFETVTEFPEVRVRRRVFAPDTEARALVAEVTLDNPTDSNKRYGLVELWDVNLYQLPVEFLTSDLLNPAITETIERRRRALSGEFSHTVAYAADDRLARVTTEADVTPGVTRDQVSEVDYYPDPIYLAVLDQAAGPDAVWLEDRELWGDRTDRPVPKRAADDPGADSRQLTVQGDGQHVILALRVPVTVPAGGSVTRRFGFGYVPGGGSSDAAVAELRSGFAELAPAAVESWRKRLVWAAFPGLDDAPVIQRELAWDAYHAAAGASYDEYRGVRVIGQGGAYRYIHGLEGAIGDLALFAEAMTLVDPDLARDTLEYALSTQHGAADATPYRYPYATTGVGEFSDVGIYTQRSDAYFVLPAAVARYVALTRDFDFLDTDLDYWPKSAGEHDTVLGHLRSTLTYATDTLGLGARGLIAMGTGDYADGVLQMTDQTTTPAGTSSTYNAGFVLDGFPLLADVVESRDAELAADVRQLFSSQAVALEDEAWDGTRYQRGFVDNGDPLVPEVLFLEPQLFPIVSGAVDGERADALLALIDDRLETDIGAMSNVALEEGGGGSGGVDQPLVGGIWPVANAWLTAAYGRRDPDAGWSSLVRNTLAAHAEAYPDLWYGIWTGPDSFNGPAHERPGEADAHAATALTDYPALNAHIHTSPLRALVGLLGIRGTAAGLVIEPHVPTETFHVIFPRLSLASEPDHLSGSVTAAASRSIQMRVLLPSGLREAAQLEVEVKGDTVVSSTRSGDFIEFTLPGQVDTAIGWVVRATR